MFQGSVVLDSKDIRRLENRIKEYGSIESLLERIFVELDATFTMDNGMRPRQTNSYVWHHTDAEFHYLIDKLCDQGIDNEIYNDYMRRYNNICEYNTLYEKENPPIDYGGPETVKSKKKATRKKVATTKDMFTGETKKVNPKNGKEIKPSPAEVRRNRIIAGASFSFDIKNK